jgi:hypothetical protein
MTVAVLAPLFGRGFVLAYDMVFAPRQDLLPDSVGLGSALPRSVPADAVVGLLTAVVPGDLVQQLLLAAALFAGPLGAGLLTPSSSPGVRLVAAVTYGWSGYVAERLFIGHWPYLLTYACLPWIARAALALRCAGSRATPPARRTLALARRPSAMRSVVARIGGTAPNPPTDPGSATADRAIAAGRASTPNPSATTDPTASEPAGPPDPATTADRAPAPNATDPATPSATTATGPATIDGQGLLRRVAVLVLVCAPAVLTPSGGIIAAVLAAVCGGARRLWLTVLVGVVLNAPWWVPSVLHPGGGLSAGDGVGAFGARAESWGGAVTSLLGLGGIWNAEVVPDSRTNPVLPVLIIAMVVVALVGFRELSRRLGPGLALLGVAGVGLAALGGSPVLGWVVEHVPGGGLLRDSQKWVAWWALPFALGFALGVRRAAGLLRKGRTALIVGAAIVPVAIMPDLALAGWGRLAPADYPSDWAQVRHILETDRHPGDVAALPFTAFRRFGWNDDRTQLDPAPRFLPRPTVIDDTLVVNGRPIAGEDSRAAAVRVQITEGGDLRELGIGWVLVEHGTPGRIDDRVLARATKVYQGEWLDLYRLDGTVEVDPTGRPPVAPVVAADALALATVTLSLLYLRLPAGSLRRSSRRGRE